MSDEGESDNGVTAEDRPSPERQPKLGVGQVQQTGSDPPPRQEEKPEDAEKQFLDQARQHLGSQYGRFAALLHEGLGGTRAGGNNFFLGDAYFRDAVAGDKHVGAGRSALPDGIRGRVAAAALAELQEIFVPSPDYDDLDRHLQTHGLLILRAREGWGKQATAVRLLDDHCDGRVERRDPDRGVAGLAFGDLPKNTGLLIDRLSLRQLTRIRPFHLDALASSLLERSSRLIITLDEDVPVRLAGLQDHLKNPVARPPLDEVMRRHVERALTETARDRIAEALADDEAAALLTQLNEEGIALRHIALLAVDVSEVVLGNSDFAKVRGVIEAHAGRGVRSWFGDLQTAEERAFVIALAAFHGLPYYTVARAARLLEDRLVAAEAPRQKTPRAIRPFARTRSQRLADARALLEEAVASGPHGDTRVQTVRFSHESYRHRVLDTVWTEYDDARPLVLDWLRDLAGDEDDGTNVHAGITVGVLATYQFEDLCREVLSPWAGDPSHQVRLAAVGAMAQIASLTEWTDHAHGVIREWSGSAAGPRRRWTAARAWGAAVGTTDPASAFQALGRMADTEDLDLTLAIAESMVELMVAGDHDQSDALVANLLRWSRSKSALRRRCAALCFLHVASSVQVEAPDARGPWPALLWMAYDDPATVEHVAALWHITFAQSRLRVLGQEVLREWIAWADEDLSLVEPLSRILLAPAMTDQDRATISFHLERWRDEPRGPRRAAERLLVDLPNRGDHR